MSEMRRILVVTLLAVLALCVFAAGSLAGPPVGTYGTGIQVQNLATGAGEVAHVTISFRYGENMLGIPAGSSPGDEAAVHSMTIQPGKSDVVYVPTQVPSLPANFIGSAVISSDQPIAAILNTTNTKATVAFDRKGSAIGVADPATMNYLPYLRYDYYGRNSYIAVQNTENDPATVFVSYYAGTNAAGGFADGDFVLTESNTVNGLASRVFYQNESGLPASFHGSAVISSTAKIAVVVNNANDGSEMTKSGLESYNGQASGATRLFVPKATVNFGTVGQEYQSGFTIQNLGSVDATMTISYTLSTGNYNKVSSPIAPNAAWVVYLATEAQSGIPSGTRATGSAEVTSDQEMVGVVTEVNSSRGYAVITNAVPEGKGSTVVTFPKFDNAFSNYFGGIQVQNVGSAATDMVAVFSGGGLLTDLTSTKTAVAPKASGIWYSETVVADDLVTTLPAGFNGSVVVTSSTADIAGIYTSKNSDTTRGDTYTAYDGVNG